MSTERARARARRFSGFWFVNVHECDREYGGPEEGGWWYGTGVFLKSRPCRTRNEAHIIMDRFNRFLDFKFNDTAGRYSDLNSVLCDGRLVASMSRSPGKNYPRSRPHYE
jgi:hypothetical protein